MDMQHNLIRSRGLGIYIHIPFCVRKCAYCDFLSGPADENLREEYVKQLCREIALYVPDPAWDEKAEPHQAVSIFLGGGTPSILTGEQISRILSAVRKKFVLPGEAQSKSHASGESGAAPAREREVPEITVECNPGTLDEEKLRTMRQAGVNRLSIGLQSADDKELAMLGRIHRWQDFADSFHLARKTGFEDINVDLMSGLPGQTRATWRYTLEKVLSLRPEHISAYSLIIEENTPFYERYHEDDLQRSRGEEPAVLPSEETERQMYEDTEQMLAQYGMHRYEISNYALEGYESLHNSGYWQRREYIGFGLGASSQTGKQRYKKTDSLKDYLRGDFRAYDQQQLTIEDEMEETMFLGLRMMRGVSEKDFKQQFGADLMQVYGDVILRLEEQRLAVRSGGRLRLTGKGIDVSNMVLAQFLLDSPLL